MDGKRCSQLIGRMKNERAQVPESASDSAKDSTYRQSFREEVLEKIQNGRAQAQSPPSTKASAERFNEKRLRAKEMMRECDVEYPQEQQKVSCLSGCDAESLLSNGAHTLCSDDSCCPGSACNLTPQHFGPCKKGAAPANSPPQRKQENDCFRYTESDLALSLGSDGESGNSSRTVSRTPSVREIRRIMTARCRAHDIITTSLRNMGYDDDEVGLKTDRKKQSPAEHLRDMPPQLNELSTRRGSPSLRHITPSPGTSPCDHQTPPRDSPQCHQNMPPRDTTPRTQIPPLSSEMALKINHCTPKLQSLYVNSKLLAFKQCDTNPQQRESPQRPPIRRHDTPPVRNPPPNPISTNVLIHNADAFDNSVRKAVHAQVISPMIQKMEKIYYRSLRSQLSMMQDFAELPKKISQVYQEQLQNLSTTKDTSRK